MTSPERPNILVVVMDDVRFDDLGFAGHPFVRTPNFDRIATEGIRFSNGFAPIPLCSPNRACILTGQYAHTHGITDNRDRSAQSHQLATFPLALHRIGYDTAFIGKWHMGLDDRPRPGFNEWLSFQGQGKYCNPEMNHNGESCTVQGYASDILSDRAAEFIRRERDRPFLVYLSHKAVHPNLFQDADGSIKSIPADGGFTPPDRFKGLYEDEPIRRRPNAFSFGEGKPALQRRLPGVPSLGPSTGTPDQVIRDRLRILTAADEAFGRVLGALEETGLIDDTLVLLTSDHGYFYGEHGLNEERRLAYEESIRVPLAMRWPRLIGSGAESGSLVLSVDIAPTILELAGSGPHSISHGRSLVPLLEGVTPADWRQSVLIEYFSDAVWPRMVNMGYQAVRTERWKYIHYVDVEGMDEVYDLEADPYEIRNVFRDSSFDGLKADLSSELDRLLSETAAPER